MAFFNPFCSEEAISYSNYCTLQKLEFKTSRPVPGQLKKTTQQVATKLSALLTTATKPKKLFGTARRRNFGVYPQLATTKATAGLARDLAQFLHEQKEKKSANATYIAVFTSPSSLTEDAFRKKAAEQVDLLQRVAEPFYCMPESEKDKERSGTWICFGSKFLKVVAIYRNTSAGQLKFDYPMLTFTLEQEKK